MVTFDRLTRAVATFATTAPAWHDLNTHHGSRRYSAYVSALLFAMDEYRFPARSVYHANWS